MKRPADLYWFNLRDHARSRGCGKCEYCQRRPARALHHRTYEREGRERLEDVMMVCDSCHDLIHGHKSCGLYSDGSDRYLVDAGSLAALGDRGRNNQHYLIDGKWYVDPHWKKYLASKC